MYPFKEIELKWQRYWEDNKTFKTPDKSNKPKYYVRICSLIHREPVCTWGIRKVISLPIYSLVI